MNKKQQYALLGIVAIIVSLLASSDAIWSNGNWVIAAIAWVVTVQLIIASNPGA